MVHSKIQLRSIGILNACFMIHVFKPLRPSCFVCGIAIPVVKISKANWLIDSCHCRKIYNTMIDMLSGWEGGWRLISYTGNLELILECRMRRNYMID